MWCIEVNVTRHIMRGEGDESRFDAPQGREGCGLLLFRAQGVYTLLAWEHYCQKPMAHGSELRSSEGPHVLALSMIPWLIDHGISSRFTTLNRCKLASGAPTLLLLSKQRRNDEGHSDMLEEISRCPCIEFPMTTSEHPNRCPMSEFKRQSLVRVTPGQNLNTRLATSICLLFVFVRTDRAARLCRCSCSRAILCRPRTLLHGQHYRLLSEPTSTCLRGREQLSVHRN